jgi:hypothetical protein
LSPGQATPSYFLAQEEDLILHAARGRVGFNKDHCPSCANQGRKSLLSSYCIIFLFTQYLYADPTKCHVCLVVSNATANVDTITPLPA